MCHTKICFKCGEEKEISLFYKHPKMADGYLNKCISCTKKYSILHRKEHPNYYSSYEQTRTYLTQRKELAHRIQIEYRNKYPERQKAVNAVTYAVKKGTLIKTPCEYCGALKVVAHHVAYDLPLEVVWLCQKHHKELHAGVKE